MAKSEKTKAASSKSKKPTKVVSLLAAQSRVDQKLSSLFATPAPIAPRVVKAAPRIAAVEGPSKPANNDVSEGGPKVVEDTEPRRKRKRRDVEEEREEAYLKRWAEAEERETDKAVKKRRKAEEEEEEKKTEEKEEEEHDTESEAEAEDNEPIKHETQEATEVELDKAARTVFLGNVSTSAITSKSDRKALMRHLSSFFGDVSDERPQIESLRFRSTPYATAMPKKAAYTRGELMDATTKSTNAYVVYSTPLLAREAARLLNGSVVLDRHLRVDQVAHPAPVDHHRCVFVGNLGFVDDESNIQDANEEDGREKRKKAKEPADAEEGLWRTFGRCGTVESVRVIRDSATRVGKGVAYVQFADANAVEAALLYNEKKFPPMLPRKLRVSRAKAQKRKVAKPQAKSKTYQRKVSAEESSRLGRAGKLLGKAGAAQMKKPEAFVFEGHRASSSSGVQGLKFGKSKKKKSGKPATRSAQRAAAYKAKKNK
ncbi:hypothetical protein K470DRAFT_265478 [Piedraia hortae CBS 480.64]|uniref:Nucleolar protein 12 n=1 Tax=Piedraia hortae CBS 480.64 TaxID=1314780 RepID=A0A6A7BVH9_9PEZI|nr:hypothetical protein K470DRAFT_265478 [Piedraia hortae CBS 480.64]